LYKKIINELDNTLKNKIKTKKLKKIRIKEKHAKIII
jgi:hypothetical protein